MFKKHAVQVTLVKNPKQNDNTEIVESPFDPEKILKILKENTKPAIIGLIAVIAAVKVIDTTCDIAVIAADAHFRK